MLLNPGKIVRLQIEGVHDGDAAIVQGELAFAANRTGKRPESARFAMIDGDRVRISAPALNKRAGVYEARIEADG
ncbi:hypothetical protein GGR88_001340 [Sphingomonas jejuensis]|uniref:TRAM domain-containing protein n=1 Tax=Sphingomonas jejuensis TaxID=904715 RepID=A0ABX0XKI4_9SPHN|nr:hypothetical protein [Sphingomonas jejuensis]NJC33866.1 hypothetical protein [Sphingomonas jejuensis]